jgi:hypothetical protein
MFRLKKSTKYAIVLIIIAASVYVAVALSNIDDIFNQSVTVHKIDDARAETIFENAANDKKIKLFYSTSNLISFKNNLQYIYTEYNINPLYANNTKGYYVSVFSFPDTLSDSIMTELRSLEKLNQEFLDTSNPDKYKINIEDHIENKLRVKRTLENKIDNAILLSEDRISRYNNDLTKIQLEIDSLRNQQTIFKSLSEDKLVYVASLLMDSSQQFTLRTRRLNMIKNFIVYLAAALIASIILLIIAHYFLLLLLKIMSLLGIKTARSSSGGYSYGGYSYKSRNYYRKPKKVKKVYKDADGNIIKQKISKE